MRSIHFCLSYNQTAPGVADKFLKDIRDAVEVLMSDPDSETTGVVRTAKTLIFYLKYKRVLIRYAIFHSRLQFMAPRKQCQIDQ